MLKWLPYIMLGAFVGTHYLSGYQEKQYSKKCGWQIFFITVSLLLSSICIYNVDFGGNEYRGRFIGAIYPVFVIFMFFICLKHYQLPRFPVVLAHYSFFIYVTHYIMLDCLSSITYAFSLPVYKFTWIIVFFITVTLSILIGAFIRHFFPDIYKILTGGRC